MEIQIVSGKGRGKTTLSAFDAALRDAGVHNYNLITLSSIIPPGSNVSVIRKYKSDEDDYGKKLYIVKAEARGRETGKYIGSALGWYQHTDGRGVFVEHEEIGETKAAVKSILEEEVNSSLYDLCKIRKYPILPDKMKTKINITKVKSSASCSLMIAVYKVEGW